MGIGPFHKSSFSTPPTVMETVKKVVGVVKDSLGPPNPDPKLFTIDNAEVHGTYLIATLTYMGCTNFEGRKILVFQETLEWLQSQKAIDPHFSKKSKLIARFRPTEYGIKAARVFVAALTMKDIR